MITNEFYDINSNSVKLKFEKEFLLRAQEG